MPSIDILFWASTAMNVAGAIFLLFGVLRTVQLARGFTANLFKRRAYWLGVLMSFLLLGTIVNTYPTSLSSSDASSLALSWAGELSFICALLVALVFVDQNLLVLREVDFFHRDTLKWSAVRRPFYLFVVGASVFLVVTSILGGGLVNASDQYTALGILAYFPTIGITLGYSAAALVVAAGRSPDHNMKRFAKLLGVSLALGVAASTIWLPLSLLTTTDLENLISNIPNVLSYYFLYRAATALSPLGKVLKEKG